MRGQDVIRACLFAVFFSVGAAALTCSVLCGDLFGYYTSRQLLKITGNSLKQLKSLDTDYEILLQQLQMDPDLVKRTAVAALGAKPDEEEQTVYPRASPEQLDAARKVLTEDSNLKHPEPAMPDWVVRCCRQPERIILFSAGACLILISFICFGSVSQVNQK
jgi:hypothetical protein